MWDVSSDLVKDLAEEVIIYAKTNETKVDSFPEIVTRCYDKGNLLQITSLKKGLKYYEDDSKEYSMIWAGFVSMLRAASHAGTATWQYVLPNKTKARVSSAYEAFEKQIDMMIDDINQFQSYNAKKDRHYSCMM